MGWSPVVYGEAEELRTAEPGTAADRRLACNSANDIVWRLIREYGDEAAIAAYAHLAYSVCTTM